MMLALRLAAWPNPWADTGELDIVVISHGESVVLADHLVQDKFTIVDVGASWCSPCHDASHRLKGYLATHDDVAVRVVHLPGEAWEMNDSPAVELLPRNAIPYFEVYAPSGKQIYSGNSVERAIKKIDRKR